MIHKYALIFIAAFAFLLAPQPGASAQNAPESRAKSLPLVSPIFGDNMVLQRGKVNTIWGWSDLAPRSGWKSRANTRPRLRVLTTAGR